MFTDLQFYIILNVIPRKCMKSRTAGFEAQFELAVRVVTNCAVFGTMLNR